RLAGVVHQCRMILDMARVSLSEYRAKKLLVEDYQGVRLHVDTLADDISRLDDSTEYVIKVDQGVKKRGKQGLIRLGIVKQDVVEAAEELAGRGFQSFLAEPMLPHSDESERYFSAERTRDGIRFLYS